MDDPALPFWACAIVDVVFVACLIAFVAWWLRGREEFGVSRVMGLATGGLVVSFAFAAAVWWLGPQDRTTHNLWLFAAVFVPVYVLAIWAGAKAFRAAGRKGVASKSEKQGK